MKIEFAALVAAVVLASAPASAAVTWTQWTSPGVSGSTTGSASGTLGGVGVTYAGDVVDVDVDYPSWTPTTTWTGPGVPNAPPALDGAIHLTGGPSTEYNGFPLTLSGTTVSGSEGNGTVQLYGKFSSISFTTPQYENYYDFTVGEGGGVPEPAMWAMLLVGFFGIGSMARYIGRKNALIASV